MSKREDISNEQPAAERIRSDWKALLDKVSYKGIVNNIPFLAFLALICVLYINNSQRAVSMQRELALAALNDPTPPVWSQFWFGSHPTVLQRAGLPASMESAGELP